MGFKILGTASGAEQDSEVFTPASVTSATVLFTVDMTNWRSVLLQVTSSGSGCTITYECSNDQLTWNSTAAVNATIGASSNPASSTSGIAATYLVQKRGKYLRARVSVYGSGTVSVAYSLSMTDTIPAMGVCAWGTAGEGSNVNGNPVPIGLEARTARKTPVANGQVVRPIGTVDGKLIVRSHSIPENEWKYAAASGGIANTTTGVTLAAAGGTGVSVYITSMQLRSETLGNPTEIVLRDGAGGTVLWRSKINSNGMDLINITFENPIKGTANTLLEFATLTATVTGTIYINAQGYYAP